MRRGIKAAIMAAFAGPAIAALVLTGAGPANAAVTTSNAPHTSSDPNFGYCNPHNLERYDFRGYNTVDLSWNMSSYQYAVHFDQKGSCLSGWLTDTHIPYGGQTMPISGYVFRNRVTFSVTYNYPSAPQGTRIYSGNIGYFGYVSGTWYDTGDHASGTWHLAHAVRMACPQFFPWFGFFQNGNGCPVPFPYDFYY